MYKQGVGDFKYHVGIGSLAQVATQADRVCVLNILGGESSDVTPVSHAFSGGNVVFGTSPGRGGQRLRTPAGDVPVFNTVLEGLNAGHRFNTGVVYLPPSAVRDGVAELVRVNPDLEKIVIVTQKVSVHDAREIRALGQTNGVDIFETFRAMADALREHVSKRGATPLYLVVGRGGPNLVRGMGALRDTCDALGLPYRLFGFDSDMSEVIQFAKKVNNWMKAGGREQVAQRLGIRAPSAKEEA